METSNTGEVVELRIFGGKIPPVGGSPGFPYHISKRWGANLYSLPRQQKAPSCGRDVAQQGRCFGNTAFARLGSTIGKFLGEK